MATWSCTQHGFCRGLWGSGQSRGEGRAAGGERAGTQGWLSPDPPGPRVSEGQALGLVQLALSGGWVSLAI